MGNTLCRVDGMGPNPKSLYVKRLRMEKTA